MHTVLSAWFVLASMTLAHGSVDLAEILAPPPSADYVDMGSSSRGLSGPFDAHQYATWLARSSSDVSGYETSFRSEGFTRGYGRTWSALSSTKASPGTDRHNWLIETVEEYSDKSGAQWRYAGIMSFTKGGGDDFVREIDTPTPHAFGALVFSGALWFVMFVKGNDVYIVRMESDVDDMTAAVVQQAQTQFKVAPDSTVAPAQSPSPISSVPVGGAYGSAVVYSIILVATLAAGGLLIFLSRRLSSG